MAVSPEHHKQFRAPPPSPVAHASGRGSSLVNEDELSDFLEHSLHVPSLILPDQIFPKKIQMKSLPEIDFQSLISSKSDTIMIFLESVAATGCIQLVSHGISGDLVKSVSAAAAGIFGLPPENKKIVSRSSDRVYGFEELEDEEEMETTEEFVWCRDEELKSVMEGISVQGFSSFSKKMENLANDIEKVADQVLSTLLKHAPRSSTKFTAISDKQELHSLVCYLHKHHKYTSVSRSDGSLKSDFIRMLIRGSADYSHALCVHLCEDASEFHVYSKKGWISFTPHRNAIVMTIGDQVQAWSSGHFNSVNGRPIFRVEDKEPISMAFLYSPPTIAHTSHGNREKTISLRHQLQLAFYLILIYHIYISLYKMF